jgi:hypothetical protein
LLQTESEGFFSIFAFNSSKFFASSLIYSSKESESDEEDTKGEKREREKERKYVSDKLKRFVANFGASCGLCDRFRTVGQHDADTGSRKERRKRKKESQFSCLWVFEITPRTETQ